MARRFPGCKTAKKKAKQACGKANKMSTCRNAVTRAVNKCTGRKKRGKKRTRGLRRRHEVVGSGFAVFGGETERGGFVL